MAVLAFFACFPIFGVTRVWHVLQGVSDGIWRKPREYAVFALTARIFDALGLAVGHLADRLGSDSVVIIGWLAMGLAW
jgi:hypothetical protein